MLVIAGTVVEVDVPAMVAAPAVVAEDGRSSRASRGTIALLAFPGLVVVQIQAAQPPEAVAAPGVERAVVAGFLDGVEDVAELDDVAAPAAVADS